MIRLRDILKEDNFPQYGLMRYTIPDQVFEDIKSFGIYKPVLYRGMTVQKNRGIWDILKNERENFRGSNKTGIKLVLPRLNVQYPVFVTRSKVYSTMFGGSGIVIPIGSWKLLQSDMIPDLGAEDVRIKTDYMKKHNPSAGQGVLSTGLDMNQEREMINKWWEENIDDVVKSYKKVTYIPSDETVGEMILDVQSYWFINIKKLYENGGKFMPKQKINTYKDLIYAIEAFNRYQTKKTKG